MVHRVRPTSTRFIHYTPLGNTKSVTPLWNVVAVEPGYFTLFDDKAPPTTRNSIKVARALGWRCLPHSRRGGLNWCFEP